MKQRKFKKLGKKPNLKRIVSALTKLTPQIVSAVEYEVITPGQGIGFSHFCRSFIYLHGDLSAKATLAGCELMVKAHEAAHKNGFNLLSNLCAHPEQFLSDENSPEKHELPFVEALARTYAIAGTCHMDAAKSRKDCMVAREFLNTSLAFLNLLQKQHPTYKPYELKESIEAKLQQIDELLR